MRATRPLAVLAATVVLLAAGQVEAHELLLGGAAGVQFHTPVDLAERAGVNAYGSSSDLSPGVLSLHVTAGLWLADRWERAGVRLFGRRLGVWWLFRWTGGGTAG